MRIRRLLAVAAAFVALAGPAQAELTIHIDKSTQHMTVSLDGQPVYDWPVSTGVAGHDTPAGEFKPFRMEKDHFSREWDDAPMPYSIFFTMQGHAIHGTNHKSLGRPASHGCVRLSVAHAAKLWALVKQEKMANTHVVLTGEIPSAAQPPAVAGRVPDRERGFDRGFTNDDDLAREFARGENYNDDDGYAPLRQTRRQRFQRGWQESNDGPRYYYYRSTPAPRRYDDAPFQFLFGR
jgi:hypothetical protein